MVEIFPTRCRNQVEIYDAMTLATFYASTVSLLQSHSPETNEVVSRNRRIGVSVSGIADWLDATSVSHVFATLNKGYEMVVKPTNVRLAREAGVPPSVRLTTVKPSGTISLLAGTSPGIHYPLNGHVLRRVRVAQNSPVATLLEEADVPHEPDVVSANTEIFEFAVRYGHGANPTRAVSAVSVYEQAALVAMLQRCWADNAVSNTLTVQPHELQHVEQVMALFAPQVKSLSLMPDREKVYAQMPLERLTRDEYETRVARQGRVQWAGLGGTDGQDSRFCTDDVCEL